MIGEITCDKMVVVLNKVDLVEETKREKHIAKVRLLSHFYLLYVATYRRSVFGILLTSFEHLTSKSLNL